MQLGDLKGGASQMTVAEKLHWLWQAMLYNLLEDLWGSNDYGKDT